MSKQEKEFPIPALRDTPAVVAELQKLVDDHEDRLRKSELKLIRLLKEKKSGV